jgi:hypothetical protein
MLGSNKSSKLGTCSNDIDCSLTGKHDLYSSLKAVNLSGCLDLQEFSKTLDQLGRTGAFHHMIRRKCASSDSGLNNLKDIQAKTLYLPLTDPGKPVFQYFSKVE